MKLFNLGFSILISFFSLVSCAQTNGVNHNLQVKIDPLNSFIEVEDNLSFQELEGNKVIFDLNSSLVPFFSSKNIELNKIYSSINSNDIGMDRDNTGDVSSLKLNTWEIVFKNNSKDCTIKYKGKIESALEQSNENYQRGFSESPGIISEIGIYLAGSTYWVPTIKNKVMSYTLSTELPNGWKTVSQGKRIVDSSNDKIKTETWKCLSPQEEIFLIGAKFTEYSHDMNKGVKAMAFLRTPDESLANKYLEVTEQYMNMYTEMIGDYPYSKFALVENFWETGYGMPSFTLLGEKIIRFPFILHSSYPHELLHNWWGNSVYIDFKEGNWCEGLTAYLADHLIKEQRGQGTNYRRSTLQKFTDFVDIENDFPLKEFLSRHDGSSEAIGYGKSLMTFHMLRQKIGDEAFIKGLQEFYNSYKYKKASFNDIRLSMEKVSGKDLIPFFEQWITRKGAPKLALIGNEITEKNGKNQVLIVLEQKQKEIPFDIDVPVFIYTDQGIQKEVINMTKRKQGEYFEINGTLQKVSIDPMYDVFRILDPTEVPPALSKIWASKKNVIILPKATNAENSNMYSEFSKTWIENDKDEFTIIFDDEIESIPNDKTAWIIGFENKFASLINNQLKSYNNGFENDSITLGVKKVSVVDKEFAITVFDPKDFNKQMIFLAVDNPKSISGLVRKLPHYGKYGYLGFEGDEPTNIIKGQWNVLNSPLEKIFSKDNISQIKEDRKALGSLKPLFSKERMMSHINYLASAELKGRGLGTPELDSAANYISNHFKKYGLEPLNEDYFQVFSHKFKDKGKLKLKNVIGIIPGTDKVLKENPVVISAHYDHLGMGWPDVHAGDEGKIHYGADDNASGVAILLELAKSLGKTLKPKRTVIFVAFTGEEAGLVGSRYFVKNFNSDFLDAPFANVNLDTDGRLFDKKLLVLNANTAKEWKFIFMGTDYTTGVKSQVIEKDLDASDQFAFIEKGIPGIQLFTGANQDYHRPSDTPKKIDDEGLVKVTTVAREVMEYLANRIDPMNFTGKTASDNTPKSMHPKKSGAKRASTGSVPDFGYKGKGVKISSVIDDSAGYKAGLKANDIIIKLNDVATDGLRVYSTELKKYQPGDTVELVVLRNGKEMKINLTLGER